MKASLIIIGNEILSGRTQDKNLSYLATWLNEIGIQLTEVRVIRDEEDEIMDTVDLLRKKGLTDAADDLLDSYKNNVIKFGLEVKKIMRKII